MQIPRRHSSVTRAGFIIGLGIGGFFDGIVLHQILQWHHMLTSAGYPPDSVENLQINTLADGFFHAATWILTLTGIYLLWNALRRPSGTFATRVLTGAMLMGWGAFNVVEGIIDHHILQIHHVRPGPNEALWDIGFLIWGAVMVIGGWILTRSQPQSENVQPTKNIHSTS
jgi:uncharacterized membrane protein